MAFEGFGPFADAEKSEVSLPNAWMVQRVKTYAVIFYFDCENVVFKPPFDGDMPGGAVQRCVYGKFADVALDGVESVVRQFASGRLEIDGEFGVADVWLDRAPDGECGIGLLKGVVAKIPKAVA